MAGRKMCGFSSWRDNSRMDFSIFQRIFLFLFTTIAVTGSREVTVTYDQLYTSGVEAYNAGRWTECVDYMTGAVDDYKQYHNNLTDCRLSCQKNSTTSIKTNDYLDLAFFDISLKASDCLRRCKKDRMGARPERVHAKINGEFQNLQPYNYLQLCAYKVGDLETAVSAAYSYLLAHPEHPQMRQNMEFYRNLPDVKLEYYKNLEAKPFQERYQEGIELYAEEEYAKVIPAMEEALRLYYQEASRCRALCQGPYDHESLPDQVNAIADHYINVLECRADCDGKMATIMGKEIPNYLPEHYNYLQYSYFKEGQLKKACEAAATYLLLDPENEEMNNNKKYYKITLGMKEADFTPLEDAARYHERLMLEEEQLKFIRTTYMFADGDLDRDGLPRRKRVLFEETPPKLLFGVRDEKYEKKLQRYLSTGINITAEGAELEGEHRVIIDRFITDEEARGLVNLAGFASQGDGYAGREHRTSPHTDFEKFEGMTVHTAAALAKNGIVSGQMASLYLSISERMRVFLEDYWNLLSPLYFHFTHLVCRTALEDQKKRSDLSHPVHSDNCHIRSDGSCPKLPPAYVERDYSAILYLNDGFEGGNFFFAHKNLSVHQSVTPRTGRMVAFEAGDYHGVQAVTRGRRCALALWFTMSERDAEVAHREAAAILRHMEVMKSMTNTNLRSFISEHEVRIVMTETDLNGPERFAADGLVTKEQCDKLIKLANEGGNVGDGYSSTRTTGSGQQSPHTEHERFAALTVKRAAESGGLQGDGYRAAGAGRAKSPHTTYEMFEGLTLIRATQLAASGKVDLDAVQLYLDIAEKARKLVEIYFNLKTPLYFDFTHLVCRTALHDDNRKRTDLSHPVHSDNCILQPDGTCKREPPAYVQRDYSAIVYLNGAFKGGEFFFTHSNLTVQASLKPHRGMLVGFNAGNFHGVKAVETGQRCAIALWFTLNKRYDEQAHIIARKIMQELHKKQRLDKREEL